MLFRHGALSRRDAFLLLIGAASMHLSSILFSHHVQLTDQSNVQQPEIPVPIVTVVHRQTQTQTVTSLVTHTPKPQAITASDHLPVTELLAHAPGWSLFRNLYMANGTLFIVADEQGRKKFPEIRMMTSTGLEAVNSPENIASREPTPEHMRIISPQEARERWALTKPGGKETAINRVLTVEGNTLLFNDPKQFLRHYYHFVAELFFGVQAFWHGAFSTPVSLSSPPPNSLISPHFLTTHPSAPPLHRAIFVHSNADGWRDDPGFNSYFLRGTLPSLIVEHQKDWEDRIAATRPSRGQPERAWHFPTVLFTDRSAAHRGAMCGSTTQRTASEAWDYMRLKGKLRGLHVGGWWAPLREAMWRFAGAEEAISSLLPTRSSEQEKPQNVMHFMSENPEVLGITDSTLAQSEVVDVGDEYQKVLPMPNKIVINYISRQSSHHRKLIGEDHEGMVQALEELVARKNTERKKYLARVAILDGDEDERKRRALTPEAEHVPPEWEFHELEAEKMSKDEQIQAAARTTIMLGVHGNGLTHLVFMKPNRLSTVIELFYPGGFAHDYYWTTRALGMRHYAVWNDTYHSHHDKPNVDYPEGFQGDEIPVHGPRIAQLIEDRVNGRT
ncbi:hypothetical protein CPB84DRAFT_1811992 [Gymnopilus junonius]|uniref:Glycosyltransferase 61 catalytic domain-containing protein n=1 Tax=Gymnopilus junonius TaxID=109634 RepID=A0A9P5NXV2_GYMJU|nr:hypothetical protein CPB84DRAFT_1811992 [Gymnopilus junonius]